MVELKLAKLPERAPVKVAIMLTPDLYQALSEYAALYLQAYGREEAVNDLIPAMLSTFLEGDRAFVAARKAASTK